MHLTVKTVSFLVEAYCKKNPKKQGVLNALNAKSIFTYFQVEISANNGDRRVTMRATKALHCSVNCSNRSKFLVLLAKSIERIGLLVLGLRRMLIS